MHKPDRLQLSLKYRLHCKDILVPVVARPKRAQMYRVGGSCEIVTVASLHHPAQRALNPYLIVPALAHEFLGPHSGIQKSDIVLHILGQRIIERIYCTTMASPVVAGTDNSALPDVARFVSISSAPSQNLRERGSECCMSPLRRKRTDSRGGRGNGGLLWQFVPWYKDPSDAFLFDHAHSNAAARGAVSCHGEGKRWMRARV